MAAPKIPAPSPPAPLPTLPKTQEVLPAQSAAARDARSSVTPPVRHYTVFQRHIFRPLPVAVGQSDEADEALLDLEGGKK